MQRKFKDLTGKARQEPKHTQTDQERERDRLNNGGFLFFRLHANEDEINVTENSYLIGDFAVVAGPVLPRPRQRRVG